MHVEFIVDRVIMSDLQFSWWSFVQACDLPFHYLVFMQTIQQDHLTRIGYEYDILMQNLPHILEIWSTFFSWDAMYPLTPYLTVFWFHMINRPPILINHCIVDLVDQNGLSSQRGGVEWWCQLYFQERCKKRLLGLSLKSLTPPSLHLGHKKWLSAE